MAMKIIEQQTNSSGIIIIRLVCAMNEERNIARWCKEYQCGKQVGIARFAFKKEELTMFRLRWEHA